MRQIDYLKEKIKKTGFPLEIEISSLLRDRWDVLYRETFFDRDGKKMRDIDLRASYPFDLTKMLPLWLYVELDIECKKNENFAWIFFTVPMEYAPEESIDGQYLDELQIRMKSSDPTQLRDIILGETSLHYHRFERFAVAFDEVYLKGTKHEHAKGKREIFEAENQLKKFIIYTNEKCLEEKPPEAKRIFVYFPCIVFDGKIFEAIVERGKLELKRCNHLILTTQYRPSYSIWEQNFLIDIVHKSYFKYYLEKITRNIKALTETTLRNRDKLIKEIEDVESLP
jgi:hypothetical protein